MSAEIETLHVPFKKFLKGERIPYVNPRSDCESTIEEGHPDFTLFLGNHTFLIEFKTDKGTLTAAQIRRKAELERAGNTVHVVRDIGVACELTLEWRRQLGAVLAAAAAQAPQPSAAERGELVLFGAKVMRLEGAVMNEVRFATEQDKLTLRKVG